MFILNELINHISKVIIELLGLGDLLGLPGGFLFFLGGGGGGAAAPRAATEFCTGVEPCGCICMSPSPKKNADEAAAIGRKSLTLPSFLPLLAQSVG